MSNKIDSSLLLSNYQPPQRKTGQQTLGKDDFLKILLVQLQNQDPMNPVEDKEFIAQMASFSTLEQMMNMTNMMEQFVASQYESSVLRYSEMIGKKVYWEEITESENDLTFVTKSGVVKSVSWKNNQIMLELENGETVSASFITKVGMPASEDTEI
ncbi:flagellar hook assembly protein FlgD [Bacillus alveayuensis]|jgi:flagellar basal-body rod modification protein FlgD|uniref:flagellar hook assembly protein FlgD n=1 Tax=Aeribacillus alveayuensis TaxID=279215 RepID=UPI0005D12B8A|nr:flagellar hook assembly protein FlgD [Bacillus alveayuensis]